MTSLPGHQRKYKMAGALTALLLLYLVMPALAHDVILLVSDPANGSIIATAPAQITAVFNEEITTDDTFLRVYNAENVQVDNGDGGVDLGDPNHSSMIVSLPQLPEGAYLVRWRVVLIDSDPTEGQFNFFVGDELAAAAAQFSPIPPEEMITFSTEDLANQGIANTTWIAVGVVATLVVVGAVAFFALRRPSIVNQVNG